MKTATVNALIAKTTKDFNYYSGLFPEIAQKPIEYNYINLHRGIEFKYPGVYMASGKYESIGLSIDPLYFGSSVNIRDRVFFDHIPQLENNKHDNQFLQNYYNKYGPDSLEWFVAEKTSRDIIELRLREQVYLNQYKCFAGEQRGFNICKDAFINCTFTGSKPFSQKRLEAIIETRASEYCLISPECEVIKGKNISELCRKYNLSYNSINKIIKDSSLYKKSYKGWVKCPKEFINQKIISEIQYAELLSKDPYSLSKFQRQEICNLFINGVSKTKLSKMFKTSMSTIFEILEESIEAKKSIYYNRKGDRIKPEMEEEIIKLYLNNIPNKQIREKFNVTSFLILEVLRRNNIEYRQPPLSKDKHPTWKKYRRQILNKRYIYYRWPEHFKAMSNGFVNENYLSKEEIVWYEEQLTKQENEQ